MWQLEPERLHVTYLEDTIPDKVFLPRCYTLTHTDINVKHYLSIGSYFNKEQISSWYTRFMRDEVLAKLVSDEDSPTLRIYCDISGGFILGWAGFRYKIFKDSLPLVLKILRYGDRVLFEKNPHLDNIPIFVHFIYHNGRSEKVENWGKPADYRLST